ncbi:transposable element Tcb2 transposase [Trichonephila clavipes]|uniref:Transposable element Tcb2 transposase n=1 Tax=Trichonephila clavipes TaxID=2585209 RepID=A0A8X6V990_TRICX|nr:transposable element Tcb2 transposase [Trichonephila clavipes]
MSDSLVHVSSLSPTKVEVKVLMWKVATSLAAPVSTRNIRKRLTEEPLGSITCAALDAHPSALPLEWCRSRGNWTAAKWIQVIFSEESRFNLRSDDNRVRVWRTRGERLNPSFALQRLSTPTAVVMTLMPHPETHTGLTFDVPVHASLVTSWNENLDMELECKAFTPISDNICQIVAPDLRHFGQSGDFVHDVLVKGLA